MMLAPYARYDLDPRLVSESLDCTVLRATDEMVEFMYMEIKLTLYRNGNLMFYHYTDLEKGYEIADEVLGSLSDSHIE